MVLQSISTLSDEEAQGGQGSTELPTAKSKPDPPVKAKAKPKAKVADGAKPNAPKAKPKAKAKAEPKKAFKRPAAKVEDAAAADVATGVSVEGGPDPPRKRPATQATQEMKTCCYMYSTGGREGIWGIKLNGSEVVRVRVAKVMCNFQDCARTPQINVTPL